ncbi:MAG: hypothetical protein QNJ64_15400 [Crocosphaera sp.]|nr:hypothetical protein [Crocosphaera sp.]
MKNVLFGLLGLTTICLFTFPAIANEVTQEEGDKVIMQNSYQGSFQNGRGNQAVQESMQIHREMNSRKERKEQGSYGAVQTTDQYQEQMGEENSIRQTTIQRTEMRNGSGRRNRN